MEIFKETQGAKGCAVTDSELKLVNEFSKSPLTAEQVYTFAVRLCDNEVDRDGERFSEQALETLRELFVGKSGMFDHNWVAEGQTARIYRTEVVAADAIMTAAGKGYRYLKGYAYMLRSERNKDLIDEIEGGIKKEVSIGCSVKRATCSICGKPTGECEHIKGQMYAGRLCFTELNEPVDAYEWSFVAVPAQKNAGVMKHFKRERGKMKLEKFLEQPENQCYKGEYEELCKNARLGKSYLEGLKKEVVSLALLGDENADGGVIAKIAGKLDEAELLELKKEYQRRAEKNFPRGTQLRYGSAANNFDDEKSFLI